MNLFKKILLTISSWILFMLILPIVFTNTLSATSAMGAYILLFFVVYPLLSLVLGMLAGTVHKALWWIPLGTAVLFPLLFSVSIGELVFDLYFYSIIYASIGFLTMAGTSFGIKYMKRNKKHE